jgi:hypothetical protein
LKKDEIKQAVKEGYDKIARENGSCYLPVNSSCCGNSKLTANIAKNIGYTEKEL